MRPFPDQYEVRVLERIRSAGSSTTHAALLAENDALILGSELSNGREIAAMRTAIYTAPIVEWIQTEREKFGYTRPFAVVALGGTGRGESAPCSDRDIAFLFDEDTKGNEFLGELRRQTRTGGTFEKEHGFALTAMMCTLENFQPMIGKDLNSFLDMRPLHDPDNFAQRFREHVRAHCDPFEHFILIREIWKSHHACAAAWERVDRFDLKEDALRTFQGGVWTLASENFLSSHEVYRDLVEPADLEAYYFLLRIRCWVNLRHKPHGRPTHNGRHPEDIMEFNDILALGELLGAGASEEERYVFATEVRARLISARRRVVGFTQSVIERELRDGRRIAPESPIRLGPGGLFHSASEYAGTPRARSQAALSLLLVSQKYDVPIDPSELQTTFRNARKWLECTPAVAALFYEPSGSLAKTFEFLNQVDGAEDRLFPGRAKFEASLDQRVLEERRELRSAIELRKLKTLEGYLKNPDGDDDTNGHPDRELSAAAVAALLDADHLAAVKLALKTKRLPLTVEDQAAREDTSLPLHERFSSGCSGIPLKEYYRKIGPDCAFSPETIAATEFLIANRRTFKSRFLDVLNDSDDVETFRALCGTEQRLHALYVFTSADRTEWENEPSFPDRWFFIRELYGKTLRAFRPMVINPGASLDGAGYAPDEAAVLRDFGIDFFSGLYQRHTNRFGADLIRLALDKQEPGGPRAAFVRDGAALILGVAAKNFRGLAACISGALWREGVDLLQAHFFSAMNYGLALDFFHIAPGQAWLPPEFCRLVENAVHHQLHIADADEAALPRLHADIEFREQRPGQFLLRCKVQRNSSGLVYALCFKVFRHLRGDIHGLHASATRDGVFIHIHHALPPGTGIDEARRIIHERF